MRQLDDNGSIEAFARRVWKVTKGSLVLARDKRTKILYLTSGLVIYMKVGSIACNR